MDWRKLFGCSTGHDLEYYPPKSLKGKLTVIPPPEILEAGISEWNLSLVGQFLGTSPSFASIQRIANKSALNWVIENSPWHIHNNPLILRKWEPNLKSLSFNLSKIPVWILLFNVPLELFSRAGLSYVDSAIGVPVSMDTITASKSRLEFAKVCVEIGANDTIPRYVDVVLKDGKTTSILVEVPWLPQASPIVEGIKALQDPVNTNTEPLTSVDTLIDTTGTNSSLQIGVITDPNVIVAQEILTSSDPNSSVATVLNVITAQNEKNMLCSKPTVVNSHNTIQSHGVKVLNPSQYLNLNSYKIETLTVKTDNDCTSFVSNASDAAKSQTEIFEILEEDSTQPASIKKGRGRPQRIWLLWRKGLDFNVIFVSDQTIIVKGLYNGSPFFLSAIYVGGDFNTFLHSHESSDHDFLDHYLTADMKDFQDLIHELDLLDHPFFGHSFTWNNKHTDHFLTRKLDRVLINPYCLFLFLFLLWNSLLLLKRLKSTLKEFNNENFNNLPSQVKTKRAELDLQQLRTLNGEDGIEKEILIQDELKTLEEAEILFLKQKAKIQWIKNGDKNTKFFHYMLVFKNKRDTIRVLIDGNGNHLDSFDAMSKELTSSFSNFLGSIDNSVKNIDLSSLKELLNYSIPLDAASVLVKDIQRNDKAPGPDGYSPCFIKKAWSIVGEDVLAAVKHFVHSNYMNHGFNSTVIALLPKVPNPQAVKDFRPISCCSIFYKAITKILVKILSEFLPDFISLNQTTFINGRSIIDNTLLVQ
ncbi:uncharacterized protein LOC120151933 [Hibiscus syriacus]|uniref:uncharacterized protein LOC120151933 n=1 Tax=Hibiscus syriacus TaxID=106335 RepID=UPI001922F74F|nr:uncharacterized protein LOC120151933 [Hibiscus syriacus]